MTAYIRVVALDTVDSSPSLAFVTENKRFLIDCGEGIQRLCVEHRIRTSKLDAILLTRLVPETVCGLPGLCLTAADAGKTKIDLIGPSHTDAFWSATKYFMRRDTFGIQLLECTSESLALSKEYGELFIHCIPVGNTHVCYVLETPTVAGKFDLEKATGLKVPKGPLYAQLKAGKTVVLPDGTEVRSEQVCSPPEPGRFLLIVCAFAAEADELLDELYRAPGLRKLFSEGDDKLARLDCVIHLSPKSVIERSDYRAWMGSFHPAATHITVGRDACIPQSSFIATTRQCNKQHLVCPDIFARLTTASQAAHTQTNQKTQNQAQGEVHMHMPEGYKELKIVPGKVLMRFDLTPAKRRGLQAGELSSDHALSGHDVDIFGDDDLLDFWNGVKDNAVIISGLQTASKVYKAALSVVDKLQLNTSTNVHHPAEPEGVVVTRGEGGLLLETEEPISSCNADVADVKDHSTAMDVDEIEQEKKSTNTISDVSASVIVTAATEAAPAPGTTDSSSCYIARTLGFPLLSDITSTAKNTDADNADADNFNSRTESDKDVLKAYRFHDYRVSSLATAGALGASVTFLGTGCAIPSKYRNVSGILLHLPSTSFDARSAVLLDAGEGTWQQMVRLARHDPSLIFGQHFTRSSIPPSDSGSTGLNGGHISKRKEDNGNDSSSNVDESVELRLARQLKAIWISHPHADHHLGLIRILSERKRLLLASSNSSNSSGRCGSDNSGMQMPTSAQVSREIDNTSEPPRKLHREESTGNASPPAIEATSNHVHPSHDSHNSHDSPGRSDDDSNSSSSSYGHDPIVLIAPPAVLSFLRDYSQLDPFLLGSYLPISSRQLDPYDSCSRGDEFWRDEHVYDHIRVATGTTTKAVPGNSNCNTAAATAGGVIVAVDGGTDAVHMEVGSSTAIGVTLIGGGAGLKRGRESIDDNTTPAIALTHPGHTTAITATTVPRVPQEGVMMTIGDDEEIVDSCGDIDVGLGLNNTGESNIASSTVPSSSRVIVPEAVGKTTADRSGGGGGERNNNEREEEAAVWLDGAALCLERAMKLLNGIGVTSILNVKVAHCPQAFGLVVQTIVPGSNLPMKIVYSGDTRPSRNLIRAGAGAALLIHEATFEDSELGLREASAKKHCTVLEALDVASGMDAHRVILTHFSQRYASVPVLPPEGAGRAILAFDFMRLGFQDLLWAPALMAPLAEAFPPKEEDDDGEVDATASSSISGTIANNSSDTGTTGTISKKSQKQQQQQQQDKQKNKKKNVITNNGNNHCSNDNEKRDSVITKNTDAASGVGSLCSSASGRAYVCTCRREGEGAAPYSSGAQVSPFVTAEQICMACGPSATSNTSR